MTTLEKLEREAAAALEKAERARAKIEEEQEKQLARRLEREREFDERLVASGAEERERLVAGSRAAYEAALAALEATPIVRAIAAFRAAKSAEWSHFSELQNAAARLGRPTSTYEPERREIDFRDMVNDAIRRAASELTTQAEKTRAAEREAFLNGDT